MTALPDLERNRDYTKTELEELFGIKFGYRINGIVVRRQEKHSQRRLILLFNRSGGPYPDLVTKDKIKYIGAGLAGDQVLSGVNKVLAERGPVDGVHFFRQIEGSVAWRYLGQGFAHYIGEEYEHGRNVLTYDIELGRE